MAAEISADAILMDDRDGRREAKKRNLAVLGTLRVLADAAEHGFMNLRVALDRLRQTHFWLMIDSFSGSSAKVERT